MILSELVTILTEAQAALDQVPQLAMALVTANNANVALQASLDERESELEAAAQQNADLQASLDEKTDSLAELTEEKLVMEAAFDEQTSEVLRLLEVIGQAAPFRNTSHISENDPDLIALHTYLANPPPASMVNEGYGEWIGRAWKSWYVAALMGYLASGNIFIVNRLEEIMESLEAIMTSPIPTFYTINESLACSMLLLHTLVMKSHGRDWQKWYGIWEERYPTGIVWDDVHHCWFASIESYAYRFLITGDESAAVERDRRIAIAMPHFVRMENGAFALDQRMPINEARTNLVGTPQLNYMRYTLASILTLLEIGVPTVDPQWFADTLVIRTFLPDGRVAFYLDGSLEWSETLGWRDFNYDKWRSSNLGLLGGLRPEIAAHTAPVSAVQDSLFMAAARLYSLRRRR